MTIPDDMNELTDVNLDRVDLVGKAANGTRFLLAKSAAEAPNLIDADTVRELIKEADAEPESLDTDAPLDMVEGGDETPGDSAWEATDAASARKWAAVLVRAKNALTVLANRERAEGDAGDLDDYDSAWDLDDAASAVDYALSVLAPYAVDEQFEADTAVDDITKAAASLDTDALTTVEAYAPIIKAGRALSAANETALRNAADAIQKVLASLPAPEEAPIEKEAPVAEEIVVEKDAAEPGALTADQITKSETLLAVYTATGQLKGAIDPSHLIAIDPGEDAADSVADTENEVTEGEVDGADEAPVTDAEADEAVIPGTHTVQSPVEDDKDDEKPVTKDAAPTIADLIKEAIEPLVKQVADLTGANEILKDQVAALGREPDDRNSPYLNGATGTAGVAKRSAGDSEDLFTELQKAVDEETNPVLKEQKAAKLRHARVLEVFAR